MNILEMAMAAKMAGGNGGSGPIDPKRLPEGYPYDGRVTLQLGKTLTEEESASAPTLYDDSYVKLYDNVLSETDLGTMRLLFAGIDVSANGMAVSYAKNEDGIYVVSISVGSNTNPLCLSVPSDNTIGAVPGFYIGQSFYGNDDISLVYGSLRKLDEKFLPEGAEPVCIIEADVDPTEHTISNANKTYEEIGIAANAKRQVVLLGMKTIMGVRVPGYVFYLAGATASSIKFFALSPQSNSDIFVAKVNDDDEWSFSVITLSTATT